MKKMYKTTTYGNKIEEVEIVSETNAFIIIKGQTRKTAKKSNWENYFDTRDAAISAKVKVYRDKIEYHEKKIEQQRIQLKNLLESANQASA